VSPSASESASPSPGYTGYTRGDYSGLPANDNDLEVSYDVDDVANVSTENEVYVYQSAESGQIMIHQFKNFVGNKTTIRVTCVAKSDMSPVDNTIYLDIYNHSSNEWDTIDADSSSEADTNFTLTAVVADISNYKDDRSVISCRVWQFAGE